MCGSACAGSPALAGTGETSGDVRLRPLRHSVRRQCATALPAHSARCPRVCAISRWTTRSGTACSFPSTWRSSSTAARRSGWWRNIRARAERWSRLSTWSTGTRSSSAILLLKRFEPDVEALLVNRVADPPRYYRAPIDQCFRLVGMIRTTGADFPVETEVWREIDRFFGELEQACAGGAACLT